MLERIETLLNNESLIATQWDRRFLKSIRQQASSGRDLSLNQISVIEKIESNNSSEVLQANKEFLDRWYRDPELRERTIAVCEYYRLVGNYYGALTNKILWEGYVPTVKEHNKLCKNKYAIRVIREHEREPRYPVNSLVQVRKSNKTREFRHLNNSYALKGEIHAVVIQANALPIRRAAKGAKIYKILPVGATRAYYVHESDIKKARGVKSEVRT